LINWATGAPLVIRGEIGGIRLGALNAGDFRDLKASEMETLRIFLKKFS
jgi:16S rRNA U516 pseudouridylate synthase RsuA-like enzyme